MTEEEKEVIKQLKDLLEKQNEKEIITQNLFENILRAIILVEKQQKELEKKDKIIDRMAEEILTRRGLLDSVCSEELEKAKESFIAKYKQIF